MRETQSGADTRTEGLQNDDEMQWNEGEWTGNGAFQSSAKTSSCASLLLFSLSPLTRLSGRVSQRQRDGRARCNVDGPSVRRALLLAKRLERCSARLAAGEDGEVVRRGATRPRERGWLADGQRGRGVDLLAESCTERAQRARAWGNRGRHVKQKGRDEADGDESCRQRKAMRDKKQRWIWR